MKEYSSGYYKVPSVGAGTANTEFETITGMSLHYFGPGEYPYKSILKETTCESVPYVLKNLGYSTHAVHNNEANFYGRRSVFPIWDLTPLLLKSIWQMRTCRILLDG